jgi:hypothetical protein
MSRRNLLGAVAALAVAPTLAQLAHPGGPDAALLAACSVHITAATEELRLLEVMRSYPIEDETAEACAAEAAYRAKETRIERLEGGYPAIARSRCRVPPCRSPWPSRRWTRCWWPA